VHPISIFFLLDEIAQLRMKQASILPTAHLLPRLTDFCEDSEIVDLWTSELLQEFSTCRPKSAPAPASKPHVAFGRITHPKDNVKTDQMDLTRPLLPQLIRPRTVSSAKRIKHRMSLHMNTKLSDSRIQETNEYKKKIETKGDKVRGTQMLNFKIDLSKAREKRKRQLQYSREIRSGAKSLRVREIDSVTRLVVQNFRKLIDCERCALFLMDDSANELYFKPVGDGDHSHARLKEIRFPASSGVAGWVASNKMMLNIKNAYHDSRFNADIDKKTGFRTRTILCHPVLSSSNQLLGVIQMVNKKKGDEGRCKEIIDKAKKKKSDKSNKGYTSAFEHFSVHDEEILGKCCSEVSRSLQEIFSQQKGKKSELRPDDQNQLVFFSDDGGVSPLKSSSIGGKPFQTIGDMSESLSAAQSNETDSTSLVAAPPRRRSSARRSSVGQLAHFMKRNSVKSEDADINSAGHGKGITEAIQTFQFRSQDSERLQQREIERRQNNPDYLLAQSKRKRMTDYGQQIT